MPAKITECTFNGTYRNQKFFVDYELKGGRWSGLIHADDSRAVEWTHYGRQPCAKDAATAAVEFFKTGNVSRRPREPYTNTPAENDAVAAEWKEFERPGDVSRIETEESTGGADDDEQPDTIAFHRPAAGDATRGRNPRGA